MEEQNNNKRVLSIELDDEVKKVSITGMDSDEKVVMKQELDVEDLKQATGGTSSSRPPFDRTTLVWRRKRRKDGIWFEES